MRGETNTHKLQDICYQLKSAQLVSRDRTVSFHAVSSVLWGMCPLLG